MNHLLKRGSKGNDVKAVQTALKIEADGIFGVITEFSVKAFQRDHNLVVDGIVGQHTWDALFPPFAPSSDHAPLGLKKSSRKITEVIVHCTATPEGNDTTVEAIRKAHMRERGFTMWCISTDPYMRDAPSIRLAHTAPGTTPTQSAWCMSADSKISLACHTKSFRLRTPGRPHRKKRF